MDAVSEPKRTIRNTWCYGKGQIILVNKIEKNRSWEKVKNKIAPQGKAAKKLVKNLPKTAGRKKWGFTEGLATTTSREAKSTSRSAHKKNMTQKKSDLASEIKGIVG